MLSGSEDKSLRLWDVSTGKEIKQLSGHLDSVVSVSYFPNEKYAISGGKDSVVIIWDLAKGMEVAKMAGFNNGEWVFITKDGYYNSSSNGDAFMNIQVGDNVHGLDEYRKDFYRPEKVKINLNDTVKE